MPWGTVDPDTAIRSIPMVKPGGILVSVSGHTGGKIILEVSR
jgi:hypothetical protein